MNIAEIGRRHEWLNTLKPGDKFAVKGKHYGTAPYTILEVAKLTPTQVVSKCQRRFAKKNLFEIGASSGYRRIPQMEPATLEIQDAVEAYKLAAWLQAMHADNTPLHVMRAMKRAHDEAVAAWERANPPA